jgi:hypothetical protein
MVRDVIGRMAHCSFLVKGWSITLASGLAALAVTKTSSQTSALLAVVGLVPVIAFWALDAYYLRMERLFRKLHDAVVLPLNNPGSEGPAQFSMELALVAVGGLLFSKRVKFSDTSDPEPVTPSPDTRHPAHPHRV